MGDGVVPARRSDDASILACYLPSFQFVLSEAVRMK